MLEQHSIERGGGHCPGGTQWNAAPEMRQSKRDPNGIVTRP